MTGEAATCFVISPIGAEGSRRRAEADLVLKQVIEPAAAEVERQTGRKIEVKRGDADLSTGDVVSSIIKDILESDILISVLFEPNANVFYEKGVAHAAGRPVIAIKSSAFEAPFDVKQHRYVEYADPTPAENGFRLRKRSDIEQAALIAAAQIGDERIVESLAQMLIKVLAEPKVESPFGQPASAAFGHSAVRNRFRDVDFGDWRDMILVEAESEIVVAGTTLLDLANPDRTWFTMEQEDGSVANVHFAEILATAVGLGLDVTLLMMNEANPALPHLLPMEAADDDTPDDLIQPGGLTPPSLREVREQIARSYKLWTNYAAHSLRTRLPDGAAHGAFRLAKCRSGLIPGRVTWTDKRMIMTPNLYSFGFNSGPCIEVSADSLFHAQVRKDLEYLYEINAGEALLEKRRAVG